MVQPADFAKYFAIDPSGLDATLKNLDALGEKSRKAEREARLLTRELDRLKGNLAAPAKGGGLVDNLQKGLGGARREMNNVAAAGQKLADGLGSAFAGAFDKLLLSGKDFKSVLRGLEKDLIRLGTRTFTSGVSAGVSAGAGSTASLLAELGSVLFGGGSGSSLIPGFAGGGAFTVGGRAGVDQNVVPLRLSKGERVIVETPAQQRTGRPSAPPVINMAFNISTPDAESFRRSQSQIQGEALRQAQRSLRRNG